MTSLIPSKEAAGSLLSVYELTEDLLRTVGSPAVHALRQEGARRFAELGIPTPKDEEYKYTPLRPLEEMRFQPAYGATVSRAEFEATLLGRLEGIHLVFVNGEYAPELSSEQALPEGVAIGSLGKALEQCPALVERYLTQVAKISDADKLGQPVYPFVALNTAFLGEGAFVFVPENVHVDAPIYISYLTKSEHGVFASHPRTLIVLEAGARAGVAEVYQGLKGPYFTNAVTEVVVKEGAVLEHVRVQDETAEGLHLGAVQAYQRRDSTWRSLTIHLGARIGRADVGLYLDGENTESVLDGIYVGTGEQILDLHSRIDHAKPHCHSFQIVKGILADRARGVFNGKIFVYQDAQKTDAKQTNQAMLLSKTASVDTKPQLEIFADDVKCTHGATVGQLREDALFYLRARGIPLREAQALLTYAFVSEVLEPLADEGLRHVLEARLFAKLEESEAIRFET